jgi:hypothetical protein
MHRLWARLGLALLTMTSAVTAANAQIAVGNRNDFQDGTTQGWMVNLLGMGGPGLPQPQVIPNGGPAGAGDAYLQLTSTGLPGPGGRLVALNFTSTWTGNYLAAGVGAISLDAMNLGTTDLSLRLLFENPMGGPPTDLALSQTALTLPTGGGWTSLMFPLFGPGGLAVLAPGMDLNALLSNTTTIRILHSPTFTYPPPQAAAQLGVDNITAVAAVPEPSTFLLVGGGLAVAAAAARRRRRV